jgi:hypothetical protein
MWVPALHSLFPCAIPKLGETNKNKIQLLTIEQLDKKDGEKTWITEINKRNLINILINKALDSLAYPRTESILYTLTEMNLYICTQFVYNILSIHIILLPDNILSAILETSFNINESIYIIIFKDGKSIAWEEWTNKYLFVEFTESTKVSIFMSNDYTLW